MSQSSRSILFSSCQARPECGDGRATVCRQTAHGHVMIAHSDRRTCIGMSADTHRRCVLIPQAHFVVHRLPSHVSSCFPPFFRDFKELYK